LLDHDQTCHDESQPSERLRIPTAQTSRRLVLWKSVRHGHHRADHQLPETGVGQEVRGLGAPSKREQPEPERCDADTCDEAEQIRPPSPAEEGDEARIDQVKLLFDSERPQVQQRLRVRHRVEVADLPPEQPVLREANTGGNVLSEEHKLLWEQIEPTQRQRGHQHHCQRGNDPPDAPCIKVAEREAARLQLSEDDSGDEIAGNDKEHVDPSEPTWQESRLGVKHEHG
jgi:hypothetical protein